VHLHNLCDASRASLAPGEYTGGRMRQRQNSEVNRKERKERKGREFIKEEYL
jgi:hypothetical protein